MTDEPLNLKTATGQNVPLTDMLGEIKCKTAPEAITILDLVIRKMEVQITPHEFDCVMAYVKARYMGD